MSLLMDALKKAEQEKKEAAKRLKETELNSAGEVQDRKDEPPPPEPEQTGPHEVARGSTTMELSLTPLENNHQVRSEEPAELTGPNEELQIRDDDVEDFRGDENRPPGFELPREESATVEEQSEQEQSGPYSIEEMEREEAAAAPDDTFAGVDLDETMEREMFEETVDGEIHRGDSGGLYDETLPGVTAAQMAEDIGSEDQPTPVAAQTVFTAGTTTQPRSAGMKWILIGACVVMIAAAGVWYYYTVTPINRDLPSPMVARGIESVPQPDTFNVPGRPEATAAAPAAESAASGGDAAGPDATAPGQSTPVEATAGSSMTESGDAAEQVTGVMESPPATAVPAEEAEESRAQPEARPQEAVEETSAETSERRPPPGALPETIEPPPSLIKISRSKAPARRGVMIEQAYRSYKNGNYATAADEYQKVLEQYPGNRDAMLGLAAIALKQGEADRALGIYARILKLNPRDSLARAALINLSKTNQPLRGESTIKLMLQDTPRASYLHFALGNVYASQSRWADAQQAFFDAYRLDSANPDYALNLAVSLDHMGKSETALDYYRTALELAANGGASFDSGALKTRIATLEGAQQP